MTAGGADTPAAAIRIAPMGLEHLDAVCELENRTFAIPWTRKSIEQELTDNKLAVYFVALDGGTVVGYCGMWHVVTEGHITNVAVAEECRGRGIGHMLMDALETVAAERQMIGLTLEVRVGNERAMRLYSRRGFKIEGYRKNYYADTKEDAVIMWKRSCE